MKGPIPLPELPEVEVLVRHLAPVLRGRKISNVLVRRPRVIRPTSRRELALALRGAHLTQVKRRAKYLLFTLQREDCRPVTLLGHLGMTGRMYLRPTAALLPKHAAVVLELGRLKFIFEDTRYFGRFTLDTEALKALGPEPLAADFVVEGFHASLRCSRQAIKVKLLDQSLVAGLGNIYASEALFVAGLSPRKAARRLKLLEVARLHRAIRNVLTEAISFGSTVPLDFDGWGAGDGVFYYGRRAEAPDLYTERLHVYDRAGRPCHLCNARIRRIVQAGRSTFYCPRCQRG